MVARRAQNPLAADAQRHEHFFAAKPTLAFPHIALSDWPFYAMRFIKGDSLAEAADQFHKSSAYKRTWIREP